MSERNMDTEELEHQYSPSRWSKRYGQDEIIEKHIAVTRKASEEANAAIKCDLNLQYGETENEKLDIFGSDTIPNDSPIFVYIHGGYWQALSRDISSYCVKPLVTNGVRVAVVGYDLAPKVTVDTIVEQIKRAAIFILELAVKLGSSGVYFGGHSAGGQLSAMLMCSDWSTHLEESKRILLRGAVHISGVFDLTPLVNTYVNDALKLTVDEAKMLSPLLIKDRPGYKPENFKTLIAVGENDSPEFKRQSQEYHQVLVSTGVRGATFLLVEEVDHFDIVENLADEKYTLTQQIIKLIKNE